MPLVEGYGVGIIGFLLRPYPFLNRKFLGFAMPNRRSADWVSGIKGISQDAGYLAVLFDNTKLLFEDVGYFARAAMPSLLEYPADYRILFGDRIGFRAGVVLVAEWR